MNRLPAAALALSLAIDAYGTPPASWGPRAGRLVPLQARDTLPHILDTIAGGAFRIDGGLRTRARLVVRDSLTWDSLWTRITARILVTEGDSMRPVRFPRPPVDFSREMLIVVARGDMPSLQYGTRIERVRVWGRELRVDICNWDPGRDVAQFWTVPAPLDIVRVARSTLLVRFVDHRTVFSLSNLDASGRPRCLRAARRPVRKNTGRKALTGPAKSTR